LSSVLADLYHRDFSRKLEQEQKKAKQESLWVRQMRARFEKNTNSNIAITGEPGIGKSTLSLTLGETLKPEVFVDHPEQAVELYVTFSGGEFGRAIKNSENGSVIIGDEFGQQMHHRQFMSEPNVALSNVLQGYRFKRFFTFMNLPGLRYIDADAQGLLTWQADVKKQGVATVFRVLHPIFRGEDFQKRVIDRFAFVKPRPALWKAYVAKKIENQERVFDKAIRTMDAAEGITERSDMEIVQEVLKDPTKYQTNSDRGLKWDNAAIREQFAIGIQRSYEVIKRLKRNGQL
jgi:hypothetical protein